MTKIATLLVPVLAGISLAACDPVMEHASNASENETILVEESEGSATMALKGSDSQALKTWYEKKPLPQDLKAALALDREFVGPDNIGFTMKGDINTCKAFASVKLPCDYNTRSTFSKFLAVNGKGVLPASGKTNPYVNDLIETGSPEYPRETDDVFIGRPEQNAILAAAVRKNQSLFKGGNLTAADVKARWR